MTLKVEMTGTHDITLTRDFAAPRALVWRAMTEPALILRWLWAEVAPMTTCQQDFRVGGTLRWVWTRQDGTEMGLSGRYEQIVPPERIVHTETFDQDWTGGETRVTTTLAEVPGGTRMVMVVRYATTAARDAAAATPMAEGMDEGYARLDTLLATGGAG